MCAPFGEDARIGGGVQQIRQERPEGEKETRRPPRIRHQEQVARQQRVVHQPPEARPRGHELDDERAAEERADHHAVKAEHRAERPAPAVPQPGLIDATARGPAPPERTSCPALDAAPATAAAREWPPEAAPAPASAARGGAATSASQASVNAASRAAGVRHSAHRQPACPAGTITSSERGDERRRRHEQQGDGAHDPRHPGRVRAVPV